MVAESSHVGLALTGAAGVRRAHVGRDLADDVAESHLELPHLVLAVNPGDCTQVLVSPGVGRDLVARGVHALDDINILLGDVDLALVDVVASDEKGSLSVVAVQNVQDVFRQNRLWAIVVSERNGTSLDAVVDTSAAIGNRANLGTVHGRSVGTSWSHVVRTARAIGILASWGVAGVGISAADAIGRTAVACRARTNTSTA